MVKPDHLARFPARRNSLAHGRHLGERLDAMTTPQSWQVLPIWSVSSFNGAAAVSAVTDGNVGDGADSHSFQTISTPSADAYG